MRSKVLVVVGMLITISMLLTACQPAAQPTPETIVQTVIVEGKPVEVVITTTPVPVVEPEEVKSITMAFGYGDIPTLDPSKAEDTSSNQVIEELFVGLSRQNEVTTATEEGMASWDISADGKTYTFHIRKDVPWVRWDGTQVVKVTDADGKERMVTANDFYYAIIRTITPATASPYAYVLQVIEGATAFMNGETEDPTTVGVKVIDDNTLEVKFVDAAAFNATILGMWVARAEPQWVIEERGDRWQEPGFSQSYGPYALKEWVHDSYATIVVNPFWPGTDAVPKAKIQEVTWYFLDEVPEFAEYEAGNMDVSHVPLADMDRVKADPVLSKELIIAPNLCTYFYGFNTQAPVVDDVRVRRALSMAVDRQSLIDNVTKGGQEPAQWFSRPGLAAAPTMADYPDLGVKYNPAEAKKVLQEYLDEKGLKAEELDITLMFNTSSSHQKIAEAIQQMWKDNLGLNVKLTNQEWKVYLVTVKTPDTPQVWRLGWCQDYPDAYNFIDDVFRLGGSSNPNDPKDPTKTYGGINYYNADWEAILKQAKVEPDLKKRTDLYAQAEQTLVWDDAVMIPIYWYTAVHVTKPYVTRTHSVLGSLEHIEKWDIDMSATKAKAKLK